MANEDGTGTSSRDLMGYERLAREALRGVVRAAVRRALAPEGLPGEHHLYITFRTQSPGVDLPEHLREEYPDEMTVVLKTHYWDLSVDDEGFSVGLSFHKRPEHIAVPFHAITRFFDPVAPFGLQFDAEPPAADLAPRPLAPAEARLPEEPAAAPEQAKVLQLDAFRKKF